MSQTNPNSENSLAQNNPSTSNPVQEPTPDTENSNPTESAPLVPPSTYNEDDSSSESEDEGIIMRWRDPTKTRLDYSRIFSFMKPYALPSTNRLRLVTGANIAIVIMIRGINLVPPYALKLAVDSISSDCSNAPFKTLIVYLLSIMLISFLSSVSHVLQTILRRQAKKKFAVDSFKHMVHLDMKFHTKQKRGSRFRIIWRGAEAVAMLMQEILFNVIPT